jgi:uncharacterized membrane protein YcjF (UPF0283 family)
VFTGPGALAVLMLVAGMIGFYVTTQVVQLYHTIASLRAWEACAATLLLGTFTAFVLGAIAYFFTCYVRLRANRQIQLRQLLALDGRAELRRQESMDQLGEYLREYPLDGDFSNSSNFEEDTWRHLRQAREDLVDSWWHRLRATPEHWITRFREDFQSHLDRCANEKVHQAAVIVAFKTAVSPLPLVDMAIVVFWSFRMMSDLCRIYHLRVGTFGTAALLTQVFIHAYVAARMDEWEEHAADKLEQILGQLPVPDLAKTLVSRVGSKAGAGLANYFLMRRLGSRASRLLRPVASY